MKKILFIISLFQLIIIAANANVVVVNGQIKNLPADKWIFYREQGGNDAMDSVKSFAGGFKFKIDVGEGEGNFYLFSIEKNYDNPEMRIFIFLDKGIINITGNEPSFKNAKLSGTPAVDQLNAYNNFLSSNEEIKKASDLYQQADKYYLARDTANLRIIEKQIDRVDSIRIELQKQWIRSHPLSPISACIASDMRFYIGLDSVETLYNYLKPQALNNYPAKNIKHAIEVNKLTGIGKTALDFTQPDTAGKPVSLKDFRGKYVLLDFWASWCGPCREENPNVVAAFNKYKDKNFTILSVSLDQPTGKEKWLNAIHKDGLTWTHVSDLKFWSNAVAKEYDIEGIPANFLLDPNGIIIAKNLRGDDLNNKLAEVLK